MGWGKETHCEKFTDTVRINMIREEEGGCEIEEQPSKYTEKHSGKNTITVKN